MVKSKGGKVSGQKEGRGREWSEAREGGGSGQKQGRGEWSEVGEKFTVTMFELL